MSINNLASWIVYIALLASGWLLIFSGLVFMSRRIQHAHPHIKRRDIFLCLIVAILLVTSLSMFHTTYVAVRDPDFFPLGLAKPGDITIQETWERGWPFRWHGRKDFLAGLVTPLFLLFNTAIFSLIVSGWYYLTLRLCDILQGSVKKRIFLILSSNLILIIAYALPFWFPSLAELPINNR
jgi:hypothetical protein